MRLKVQITVESGEGESEMVEVACLERANLRPDSLGLSLAEARSILAGLEQTVAQNQVAEFIAQAQGCPRCGQHRACKGHHRIVFRTPFGKLKLDSPQLYRCPCESQGPKSVSPLAELLLERTSPELAYLETKFAALASYGLTLKLLEEVLPIGQALSTRTIRRQVHQAAGPNGWKRSWIKGPTCSSKPCRPTKMRLQRRRPRWWSAWTAATSTLQANAREPRGGLKSSWVKASPPRIARRSVSAL
jgi:hypothetical protein